MSIRHVLLTTDFSDAARSAYGHAALIAKAFDATVHLVHVEGALPPFYYLSAEGIRLDIPDSPYLRDIEKQLKDEAALEVFSEVKVTPRLLYGEPPVPALTRYEKENDIGLVVLATHGRTGLKHFFLGSFAERIVRSSKAPVLTTHTEPRRAGFHPREVLVPIDLSVSSRTVFPYVRDFAKKFGSRFTFLHVIEPMPEYLGTAPETFTASVAESLANAPRVAEETFDELRSRQLEGVQAEFLTRTGRAAKEIVRAVEEREPDLVLLSTHGWTGFQHFVLGSVAERVLRQIRCDVLTVRTPAPEAT